MKTNLKFAYKFCAFFFIIFHFKPNEIKNSFEAISYLALMLVFIIDFASILYNHFKKKSQNK